MYFLISLFGGCSSSGAPTWSVPMATPVKKVWTRHWSQYSFGSNSSHNQTSNHPQPHPDMSNKCFISPFLCLSPVFMDQGDAKQIPVWPFWGSVEIWSSGFDIHVYNFHPQGKSKKHQTFENIPLVFLRSLKLFYLMLCSQKAFFVPLFARFFCWLHVRTNKFIYLFFILKHEPTIQTSK